MTGYGKKEVSFPDKKLNMEIKSLNSKNSDIYIKIPHSLREKEMEIRQIIDEKLCRGKIELNLFYELNEGVSPVSINKDAVKSYYLQLTELHNDLNLDVSDSILDMIMRLPDTLKSDKTSLDQFEWDEIKSALNAALKELDQFRMQEGKALENDLNLRLKNISNLLAETGIYEPSRIEQIREKLISRLKEISTSVEFDHNRLEQELVYYIDKLDISEEKSRLANHLKYFSETMIKEETPGRKLGFIAQEMGREINTLGSKANDFQIQKIVVQMKDELEKIKEQLLNVL
jgi:uncharacterized protein (TIGR00255 family)